MPKHGKKYLEARKKVDRNHQYDPAEALLCSKKLPQLLSMKQ